MKTITFILIILSALVANAQDKVVYQTLNPNIGFGEVSDCSGNQYLDFCVNGPLVEENGLPVGGYIDNGAQAQNWVNPADGGGNFAIKNGVFGLGVDGNLYMVDLADIGMLPNMQWAFQNGPILVQDSINARGTSQSKYVRSGIGYKTDGTLIVIVSLEPVTFKRFAELFVEIGCVNALYLDGGPYVGYSDNENANGMVEKAMKLQFYNN